MAKKKPMSLRERMANRHKQIDQASGFGPTPKKKVSAKKKADGTTVYLNRKKQEDLK